MHSVEIEPHINDFIKYAKANPTKIFWVTRIGCGLAGWADSQIAPMFKGSPINCNFAIEWKEYLE